jgi:AmiR/NasT family two-component response regulator
MRITPNFAGWRATILHRQGETTERLSRQLGLLGLIVSVQWEALSAAALPDIVLADADEGWNGLLPWSKGETPRPLIALLGSEAPGRVAWAMDQGVCSIIAKPLAPSAVYPALVMAHALHRERKANVETMTHLEERIRLRPLVHAAVEAIMKFRIVDESGAYTILRNCAMQRRQPIEQIAGAIVGGSQPIPEVG